MASVSGDGAYDTKACHAAIERGAQAMIPPRKNAQLWTVNLAGVLARMDDLGLVQRARLPQDQRRVGGPGVDRVKRALPAQQPFARDLAAASQRFGAFDAGGFQECHEREYWGGD